MTTFCRTCCGPAPCGPCRTAALLLGPLRADATAFCALAPVGGELARDLLAYKHPHVPAAARAAAAGRLAARLRDWLAAHEATLAAAAGAPRFDRLTTVPSTLGRRTHPLPAVAGGRAVALLVPAPSAAAPRGFSPARYRVVAPVRGRSVLVVEDAWVTGAHAQSAAAALKRAGARAVAVLALGRWLNPAYPPAARLLAGQPNHSGQISLGCLPSATAHRSPASSRRVAR